MASNFCHIVNLLANRSVHGGRRGKLLFLNIIREMVKTYELMYIAAGNI